ncbi:MAG: thioredoxin family protein [Mycoplasmatales bacterium]
MKTLDNIEQIQKGKAIIVFSSDWCSDCIVLKQYINEVVQKYEEWDFYYAERDKFIDLAKFYNVCGIPSFVALQDGKFKLDFISKEAKSYKEICEFMDKL